VFRAHHRRVRVFFGISDVALVAVAFQIAYWTRVALNDRAVPFERNFYLTPPIWFLLAGFSAAVWLALGAWWEVYDRIDAAHSRVILRDAFRQCAVGAAGVILLQFFLRLQLSRSFLAMFVLFTWILLCLFRLNAGRMLGAFRRGFGVPSYIMVVGTGEPARRMGMQIEEAEAYGVRLSGFLVEPGDVAPAEIELRHVYPVHRLNTLPDLLSRHVIDEIIFAVDSRRLAGLEDVFLLCDEEGVRTRIAVDFFPHMNSRVYLDRLGISPLLTFSATPHDDVRLLIKRGTDVLLAGAALLVLFPFMILIALLIKLTSRGPVIFRQTRCGLNGRRFVFYKFRSMVADAEERRVALEHLNEKSTVFKMKNDPRLTAVGRWLRKFSIDEWPQLWNVWKGDMSLVGPRPPLPSEVEQYERWQRRRLRMRPGLTCLWVVSGRDRVDFETWMRLDMQYIDTWSLALDWKIIFRTIPQVLLGRGAH